MKFQPDRFDAHSITGYGPGWISVGAEKVHSSLVIGSRGLRQAWDCARFEDLSAEHFAQLALLDAEVLLKAVMPPLAETSTEARLSADEAQVIVWEQRNADLVARIKAIIGTFEKWKVKL